MLPKHGKIDCSVCFPELVGDVFEPNNEWKMINDPGAWGGNDEPDYLVLGFSKGFTQAGMCNDNKFEDIAFGSLIRCSVSRKDCKKSAAFNERAYSCTGPLITKSFDEIPEIISNYTRLFLTGLSETIKAVIFLSNSDKYVCGVQHIIENLYPRSFNRINPMCVEAQGKKWVHIAHASGSNGHFIKWLKSDLGAGLKRLHAIKGLNKQ
jgi:hypothetical protein